MLMHVTAPSASFLSISLFRLHFDIKRLDIHRWQRGLIDAMLGSPIRLRQPPSPLDIDPTYDQEPEDEVVGYTVPSPPPTPAYPKVYPRLPVQHGNGTTPTIEGALIEADEENGHEDDDEDVDEEDVDEEDLGSEGEVDTILLATPEPTIVPEMQDGAFAFNPPLTLRSEVESLFCLIGSAALTALGCAVVYPLAPPGAALMVVVWLFTLSLAISIDMPRLANAVGGAIHDIVELTRLSIHSSIRSARDRISATIFSMMLSIKHTVTSMPHRLLLLLITASASAASAMAYPLGTIRASLTAGRGSVLHLRDIILDLQYHLPAILRHLRRKLTLPSKRILDTFLFTLPYLVLGMYYFTVLPLAYLGIYACFVIPRVPVYTGRVCCAVCRSVWRPVSMAGIAVRHTCKAFWRTPGGDRFFHTFIDPLLNLITLGLYTSLEIVRILIVPLLYYPDGGLQRSFSPMRLYDLPYILCTLTTPLRIHREGKTRGSERYAFLWAPHGNRPNGHPDLITARRSDPVAWALLISVPLISVAVAGLANPDAVDRIAIGMVIDRLSLWFVDRVICPVQGDLNRPSKVLAVGRYYRAAIVFAYLNSRGVNSMQVRRGRLAVLQAKQDIRDVFEGYLPVGRDS